jgi:hypothetical protein
MTKWKFVEDELIANVYWRGISNACGRGFEGQDG